MSGGDLQLTCTFFYDSKLWSNKTEYNLPRGETRLDDDETKLPTYWNTPFTKICLGMRESTKTLALLLLTRPPALCTN